MPDLELHQSHYAEINSVMTQAQPDRSSALMHFNALLDWDCYSEPPLAGLRRDTSFTRQMQGAIGIEKNNPFTPDIFLVTAFSAIPVADAVRGFYEELGELTPPINYVMADRIHASPPSQRTSFFSRDHHLARINRENKNEIKRLRSLVKGAAVCVIDEYTASHTNLQFGAWLTQKAGAKLDSRAMRGNWYASVDKRGIDLEALTSRHAIFMRSVGHRAARNVLTVQFANS